MLPKALFNFYKLESLLQLNQNLKLSQTKEPFHLINNRWKTNWLIFILDR